MTETTRGQHGEPTAGLRQVMRSTGYASAFELISMTSSPHGDQFKRNALLGPLTGVRGVKRETSEERNFYLCALLAGFANCTTNPNRPVSKIP